MKQRITHEEYQTLPNDQKLRYNQIRPIGCDMHPYYELRANFSSSSVDEIIWKTRNVQSLENHLKAMGLTPLISPEEKVLQSVREFETHSSFIEGFALGLPEDVRPQIEHALEVCGEEFDKVVKLCKKLHEETKAWNKCCNAAQDAGRKFQADLYRERQDNASIVNHSNDVMAENYNLKEEIISLKKQLRAAKRKQAPKAAKRKDLTISIVDIERQRGKKK